MRIHRNEVAGQAVTINVVTDEDDLRGFRDFIRGNLRRLAVDSETTGLDIYNDGFRCRLVQFGTPVESWVVPVERGGAYKENVRLALRAIQNVVFHNASFDLQVFEQTLGIPMEDLWPKTTDTKILAHLIDPRASFKEGGIGGSLEEVTKHYIDPEVAEKVKGLMTALAKKHKTTKEKIWKSIPLDDPDYEMYSGMDPILAARLLGKLQPIIPKDSVKLISYEHEIAEICSYIERQGFLLDVEYSQNLSDELLRKQEEYNALAKSMGCENVNSTEQVADALEHFGVRIKERTPTGKRKVDASLLEALAEDKDNPARPLALAISEGKKAGKWRKTWVQKFLDTRDSQDRCHASINPLQARTARMSITGIPAQTLPAGDWMIRRCFLADEGHRIASVDYQAQELRVLAALSKDPTMVRAFQNDEDLHLLTARAAFGDHITKDDPERKYAKVVNFGRVYGGGAKTVAEQTGLDMKRAKIVVEGFDRAYPLVKQYGSRLQVEGQRRGYIYTGGGRRLPVDPARAYAALNYMIQSSSRDVTCRALIRLHKAGFTPYLRLPIHDEVLASLPAEKALGGAARIADLMAEDMGPVHIGTDAEVGGRSWGSLYFKQEEKDESTHPYLLVA